MILVVILLLIQGCSAKPVEPQKQKQQVKLYFADKNNEDFLIEEREIQYIGEEDKYKITLEQLIKGPENQTALSNIQKDTNVYGTIRQKGDLIVNLSQEFNQFGGSVAEILGVGAIVNTMTQFDGIERVKILVEGEELIGPSGQPRGFMEPFIKEPQGPNNIKVTLYFANDQATAVRGESRTVSIPYQAKTEDSIRQVIEELIKGPTDKHLYKTIPAEAKVLSVEIKEQTAFVDFSKEIEAKHWGGAAGEAMTINSLVNTITEFKEVQKVMLTVEGQPMNIEHMIIEEPMKRNESMIENTGSHGDVSRGSRVFTL